MHSKTSGNATLIKAVGLAMATVMTITGCTGGSAGSADDGKTATDDQAVVVRVIDGDTFEADLNGEQKTI